MLTTASRGLLEKPSAIGGPDLETAVIGPLAYHDQ
jgi:hypothetical protein